MRHDYRRAVLSRMAVGMADIQLSHNALATEVILIYNDLSIDHYQDSRIAEIDRIKKLAIFRKSEELTFVPDDSDELLDDKESAIPYEVLTTNTGLPRLPRRDDMLLSEGNLYTVHHVKPMNRDIDGLIQLIVYPERTTFIDPLNIYKLTLLDADTLLPIPDLAEYERGDEPEPTPEPEPEPEPTPEPDEPTDGDEPDGGDVEPEPEPQPEPEPTPTPPVVYKDIVLDIVWGGNPTEYSFDNETWKPFQSRIRFNLSEKEAHRVLYIRGGMEIISQIVFFD